MEKTYGIVQCSHQQRAKKEQTDAQQRQHQSSNLSSKRVVEAEIGQRLQDSDAWQSERKADKEGNYRRGDHRENPLDDVARLVSLLFRE